MQTLNNSTSIRGIEGTELVRIIANQSTHTECLKSQNKFILELCFIIIT